MPTRAASLMMGQGVSSRSSHSWALGRITFSANSCTQFLNWTWSSFRSIVNCVAGFSAITISATVSNAPASASGTLDDKLNRGSACADAKADSRMAVPSSSDGDAHEVASGNDLAAEDVAHAGDEGVQHGAFVRDR